MRPKKSLGQNFLKSKAAVREILTAAAIMPGELLLEVGPGKGVLTEALLVAGAKVIAIEKDDRLIELLKVKFSDQLQKGALHLIHQDVLEFEPERHLLKEGGYKIVANIPYYITGSFIRKFLTSEFYPEKMVLMLQKEVAKRIVARDGKESLLSLSVKVFGEPQYIKTVPAKYFSPAPKVDSAILLIKNISRDFFNENKIEEEKFFALLHAGFAHRRKYLIGNLKGAAPKIGAAPWESIFTQCNISLKTRAEDLELNDWRLIITKL